MGAPIFDALWADILARRTAAQRSDYLEVSGVLGIDSSDHQGSIAWSAVAASGRGFAMIKASEGASTSYPTLDAQYQGATAAGLTCGLYHFGDPTLSPQINAAAFAQQVNRLGAVEGHLPPALDLEVGGGNLSGWVQTFVATLRQLTGCQQVCVYSDVDFFQASIGESLMDDDTVLWLAEFNGTPGQLSYSSPRLAIHQYSQTGLVPGVAGDVDLNFAMQPLSQIIVGEGDELTPEQAAQLATVTQQVAVLTQQVADMHQQLCGLYTAWAGGKTDANNTPYDMLQLLMRNNVEIVQAGIAADEIKALISTPAPAAAPAVPVDAKQLADQIVAEFLGKLSPASAA